MKKICAMLLVLGLLLSMVGCGTEKKEEQPKEPTEQSEQEEPKEESENIFANSAIEFREKYNEVTKFKLSEYSEPVDIGKYTLYLSDMTADSLILVYEKKETKDIGLIQIRKLDDALPGSFAINCLSMLEFIEPRYIQDIETELATKIMERVDTGNKNKLSLLYRNISCKLEYGEIAGREAWHFDIQPITGEKTYLKPFWVETDVDEMVEKYKENFRANYSIVLEETKFLLDHIYTNLDNEAKVQMLNSIEKTKETLFSITESTPPEKYMEMHKEIDSVCTDMLEALEHWKVYIEDNVRVPEDEIEPYFNSLNILGEMFNEMFINI